MQAQGCSSQCQNFPAQDITPKEQRFGLCLAIIPALAEACSKGKKAGCYCPICSKTEGTMGLSDSPSRITL